MDKKSPDKKYAVFYAHGERFIRAALEDGSVREKLGTTLQLNERSLLERSNTCPNRAVFPCCTHLSDKPTCAIEEQRDYKIVGIKVFEGDKEFAGYDGVDDVLQDREWEDKRAINNLDFFDWYFAFNILGAFHEKVDPTPFAGSILVDLE